MCLVDLMDLGGVEPPTLRLLAVRSNQLSYRTLILALFNLLLKKSLIHKLFILPRQTAHTPG